LFGLLGEIETDLAPKGSGETSSCSTMRQINA
jgi:hypothetical protein